MLIVYIQALVARSVSVYFSNKLKRTKKKLKIPLFVKNFLNRHHSPHLIHSIFDIFYPLKIISSDPPFIEWHGRFTRNNFVRSRINDIIQVLSLKFDSFQSWFLCKSHLRIFADRNNEGNCQNSTLLKLEKRRFLPH